MSIDVYVYFIDYLKAFNCGEAHTLIEVLKTNGIDLRIVQPGQAPTPGK